MTTNTDKTAAELVGEQRQAVKVEAAKDVAKDAVRDEIMLDTGTSGEIDPLATRFLGSDEIMLDAPILDLGIDAFEARIDPKGDFPLPENKVAGLYKLERNGQNRTPYVKAMRKVLKLKKGEDVPGAGGPSYTSDVTNISDL